MRSFWHYRRVLLNPRYGLFGLVCFPLDFLLYFMLAPLTVVGALAAAGWLVARYGVWGGGVVLVGLLSVLVTPLRRVALYLGILLASHGALIMERQPRIRWMTQRH